MRSATIIPLRRTHDARKVQNLLRAVRHRQIAEALAEGSAKTVSILCDHAAREGRLDLAGILGLQHAFVGLRAAMSELADAHKAVEVAAMEASDA